VCGGQGSHRVTRKGAEKDEGGSDIQAKPVIIFPQKDEKSNPTDEDSKNAASFDD
jgi:hypothetical protein